MLDEIVAAYKVEIAQFKERMNKLLIENEEVKKKYEEVKRERDSGK
jgi:FtsZ-binding cell division protein ZapB